MRVSGGKSEGSQCGNVLLLLYDLERIGVENQRDLNAEIYIYILV